MSPRVFRVSVACEKHEIKLHVGHMTLKIFNVDVTGVNWMNRRIGQFERRGLLETRVLAAIFDQLGTQKLCPPQYLHLNATSLS